MLRPLLHFFLIGGLLFSAKASVFERWDESRALTVYVSPDASAAEIETEIRNQILLHEARQIGWYRTDPVVFTHLVRNMKFIDPDTTDDERTLFERALEMNMQEHDPVVRARLLYRANQALGHVPAERMPTVAQLEEHRSKYPERFEREGKIRFHHVFLSGTKHGDALPLRAAEMRRQLDDLGGEAPRALGDPLPGLRLQETSTLSAIARDYGEDVASVLEEGIVGTWRGPIRSVYGIHFVRLLEVQDDRVPSLAEIEAEVRADRLSEIREELREERMTALRQAYTVRLEPFP